MELDEMQVSILKYVLYNNYIKEGKYRDLTWASRVEIITKEISEMLPLIDKNLLKIFVKSNLYVQETNVIDEGYIPWLDKEKENIQWKHTNAYEIYLISKKNWDIETVSSINESTDIILDHMGNPKNDEFLKRGLVIGDIQSGKTANFTFLINKAIDAGYKFVILLSGLHNDLRSQTQIRIENEVLGYTTTEEELKYKVIGIGEIPEFESDVETMTGRGPNDDFKKAYGKLIQGTQNPLVCVVKKNSTVLRNLLQFIKDDIAKNKSDKLETPVLIIDDEVDQASVNTLETENPSTINKLIRSIIKQCKRISYVGYTATPYANIFINDDDIDNEDLSNDLFPKDFVVSLPTSKNYCGVTKFFGNKEEANYDLVELIADEEEFLENPEKNKYDQVKFGAHVEVIKLPNSIINAIDDYIISSAIRKSREGECHCAMMAHIAATVEPARSLKELIEEHIKRLKINYINELPRYKKIWEERFKNVSLQDRFEHIRDKYGDDTWERIEPMISKVFNKIEIKLLNGESNDYIDYTNITESNYIVVGGNKLSRGLTIEGLTISYYIRSTAAYDVAMQMGRWFGYKLNYLDVCRIYGKKSIINDFIHIYDATEELRNDVDLMNSNSLTPREFGFKIKCHERMRPTSLGKMKDSKIVSLSFADTLQQTIKFDLSKKDENIIITNEFVHKLSKEFQLEKDKNNIIFSNIGSEKIIEFLNKYNGPNYESMDNIDLWINYIKKMNSIYELTNWKVVISSLDSGTPMIIDGNEVYKHTRTMLKGTPSATRVISRPEDFRFIYKKENELRKNYNYSKHHKDSPEVRNYFTKQQGLLVIYPLDMLESGSKRVVESSLIGVAIWFPYTENAKNKENYRVNTYYEKNKGNQLLEVNE